MRVWPYQMLDVLPWRQLLSQWRECLAIAGTIKAHGKLNHATVNRVNEYPIEHFACYCDLVRKEFARREWTIGENTLEKLNSDINYSNLKYSIEDVQSPKGYVEYLVNGEKLFGNFHSERHIKQCLYSFQERYDCETIDREQWETLCNKFHNLIDL